MALEIVKAEGCLLTDVAGKTYIDGIGGISVANTGHRHPAVLNAINRQLEAYMHIMVYGEFVESPQVQYATSIAAHMPAGLDAVYFTNSGAEAVEAGMKLAKRITGRTGIVAFQHSYHGSTQGALSIIGDEYWRNAYRPLLPGIRHLVYNNFSSLEHINEETACVIAETVQAEAGVKPPAKEWMIALRSKCTETGTLLILDEIQTGFGRTGTLWGFEQFEIVPDMVLLGKALGGGMPLGALVTARAKMNAFTENPVLGHITTFGGHPVSCAAGLAAMNVLLEGNLIQSVKEKENLFRSLLNHPSIKAIHSHGLWLAVEFDSFDTCKRVIDRCLSRNGTALLTDWFLFAPQCLRLSPPLTISAAQIKEAAAAILEACD